MSKDYYKILGVSKTATAKEIKAAYWEMYDKCHPDKNPNDPEASTKFADINEAKQVLTDPDLRAEYDKKAAAPTGPRQAPRTASNAPPTANAGGRAAANQGETRQPPPRAGTNNPLNDLFGGMGGMGGFPGFGGSAGAARSAGASQASPSPGVSADEIAVTITLEEAFQGVQRVQRIEGRVPCPECRGTGRSARAQGGLSVGVSTCPQCKGKGSIRASEEILVNVPAGSHDGIKLKVKGKGPADSRGQRGDLLVTVRVKKDDRFEMQERDVILDAAVPYTVLTLGGEAEVETPAGRQRITVPSGTQSGQRIKMAGMGLPALGKNPAGDLYARVKVAIPRDIGAEERKLLIALAKMRNETVKA